MGGGFGATGKGGREEDDFSWLYFIVTRRPGARPGRRAGGEGGMERWRERERERETLRVLGGCDEGES